MQKYSPEAFSNAHVNGEVPLNISSLAQSASRRQFALFWLSRIQRKDFVAYADVCFREFGDRVLHWTTINEANVNATGGYDQGMVAPGCCSARTRCAKGNSSTEAYIVGHNMILAHSAAANLYREKYKAKQNGCVGFSIYAFEFVPYTNSTDDVMAAQRARDFFIGWLINPFINGDYPDTVKQRVQARLPLFAKQEAEQIKGTLDFIGLNHYETVFVKDSKTDTKEFYADMAVELIFKRDDDTPDQFSLRPWGLRGVLEYLKQAYGNPPIYIQENGQATRRNGTLIDTGRVQYLHAYIGSVLDALRNGSNTKGYFIWTLLDCLEVLSGWRTCFGLYYVDLDDENLRRYQKLSGRWYSNFLNGKRPLSSAIISQVEGITYASHFS